ncbi:MFS transporter [Thermococcus sp. JCM 11816]|uniref:MFS transporter n=1 Tax=Thermococcus sp. (strain JCM 11816 / KS-1) TaxID=1295125 RepID=UPI0034677E9E
MSYFLAGYTWAYIGISTTSIISRYAPPPKERGGALIGTYNMISSLGAIAGNFLSGFLTEGLGFTVNFTVATALLLVSILPLLGENVKSRKSN